MKKNLFLLLLLGAALCGCRAWRAMPEMSLNNVLVNDMIQTDIVDGNIFENEGISIDITNTTNLFTIKIQNRTGEALSLVWDESAIIYPGGESVKVVTGDTKFIDAEKSALSTAIPPYSSISQFVCGLNQINQATKTVRGFFPAVSKSRERLSNRYKRLEGQEMRVYLQLRNNANERTGYLFIFNIDGFKPV
jgi:hypothetical protein